MTFCRLAGVGFVAMACTLQACSSSYQYDISCRGAFARSCFFIWQHHSEIQTRAMMLSSHVTHSSVRCGGAVPGHEQQAIIQRACKPRFASEPVSSGCILPGLHRASPLHHPVKVVVPQPPPRQLEHKDAAVPVMALPSDASETLGVAQGAHPAGVAVNCSYTSRM